MAFIAISKRTIGPKKTETITTSAHLGVTVWVERGSVDVLSSLEGKPVGKIASAGAVPLAGAVHLRNPGKAKATVFVAMVELPKARSAELPASFDLSPMLSNVLCDVHGLVTPEPLSEAGCEAAQEQHIEDSPACADKTVIRPA